MSRTRTASLEGEDPEEARLRGQLERANKEKQELKATLQATVHSLVSVITERETINHTLREEIASLRESREAVTVPSGAAPEGEDAEKRGRLGFISRHKSRSVHPSSAHDTIMAEVEQLKEEVAQIKRDKAALTSTVTTLADHLYNVVTQRENQMLQVELERATMTQQISALHARLDEAERKAGRKASQQWTQAQAIQEGQLL
eukprot:c19921_g1_i1.p2 GENE.c19921_g1_i1~~c19921_g1_i1.p2  ORF type:complete len:203 (-),score=48.79 c19921_g1_i1:186-794(-)